MDMVVYFDLLVFFYVGYGLFEGDWVGNGEVGLVVLDDFVGFDFGCKFVGGGGVFDFDEVVEYFVIWYEVFW